MKRYSILLLTILLVVSLSSAYAGSENRIGTAGAQELRLPIGSRGTAMGGAAIADITGVESVFWNVAGLASLRGTEAMFTHQPYIADIDVNFVGMATNIEDFGTVAGAVKIVSIGDMEETTVDAPDGTGRIYSPTLSVLSLSYSRNLTYNVSLGITGKVIYEKIFEVTATGAAFDIGIMYDPDWHGLSFGMTIKDYGPEMRFNGRGFDQEVDNRPSRPISADFDLPSSFNLGAAYEFVNMEQNVARVTGNFQANNFSKDIFQGGLEYAYDGKYFLRAGYNYSDQEKWLYGFSAGAGLSYELGGTLFTLEYSWTETDVFDDNQYFTVKVQF